MRLESWFSNQEFRTRGPSSLCNKVGQTQKASLTPTLARATVFEKVQKISRNLQVSSVGTFLFTSLADKVLRSECIHFLTPVQAAKQFDTILTQDRAACALSSAPKPLSLWKQSVNGLIIVFRTLDDLNKRPASILRKTVESIYTIST